MMTKLLRSFSSRSLLALAALAVVLTPQALKAQCPQGNATMNGTYEVSGSGTVAGVGPIAVVGEVTYNGDGTGVTVSSTVSVNGATAKTSGVAATFTVNSDCTGSKTFGSGPSAQHYDFVITPDGSKITWIVTDNGVVLMGSALRFSRGA